VGLKRLGDGGARLTQGEVMDDWMGRWVEREYGRAVNVAGKGGELGGGK